MKADVIEQNLGKVRAWFVYGERLLSLGLRRTDEGEEISADELYCVTAHGIWRVE